MVLISRHNIPRLIVNFSIYPSQLKDNIHFGHRIDCKRYKETIMLHLLTLCNEYPTTYNNYHVCECYAKE